MQTDDKVTLVRDLQGPSSLPIVEPVIPDLYEVWTWEGDASVLPMKWEALIAAAFGDDRT